MRNDECISLNQRQNTFRKDGNKTKEMGEKIYISEGKFQYKKAFFFSLTITKSSFSNWINFLTE